MFGSLFHWFGAGDEGRGTEAAVWFTPQLEVLGARITPASRPSGTGDFGQVAVAADVGLVVHPDGSKPGVVSGSNAEVAHGAWVGGVDPAASKPTNSGDIW